MDIKKQDRALNFVDGAEYAHILMRNVKERYRNGELDFANAVKILDKESVKYGSYREYYNANKMKIIKGLYDSKMRANIEKAVGQGD